MAEPDGRGTGARLNEALRPRAGDRVRLGNPTCFGRCPWRPRWHTVIVVTRMELLRDLLDNGRHYDMARMEDHAAELNLPVADILVVAMQGQPDARARATRYLGSCCPRSVTRTP